jgi:hypothetical protein
MLQGLAGIRSAFSNLGTYAGQPQAENIFQNQIDQQALSHKLANERIRAMQAPKTGQDSIVQGVKQYAEAAGIADKPWEEQVEAYRKVKQSMYSDKDPRTSEMKNVEFLTNASPEERKAFFDQKGIETQQLPDGSLVSVKEDGSTEVLFDAEGQWQGAMELASSKATGTKEAEQVSTDMARLRDIAVASVGFEQTMGMMDGWIDQLSSTDPESLKTGLVNGFLVEMGLGGTELEGEALANEVEQALYSLQITNLAPVTEKEIEFIKGLFMDLKSPTDVNIGKLKGSLKRIARHVELAEFEADRSREYVMEFGDQRQQSFINQYFPQKEDASAALDEEGL